MEINPIDLQKHLKGASYPASKDDLVSVAEGNDAPDEIVDAIRSAPEDTFDSPADVQAALA
jgi:hypothetical protein